jgi:ribosomal protein RSM22 (predicted rRNA methylase)
MVGIIIAYHYAKHDWLTTQKEVERKRYEAMRERYRELCESDDPEDHEFATRLNTQLLEYFEKQEFTERSETR